MLSLRPHHSWTTTMRGRILLRTLGPRAEAGELPCHRASCTSPCRIPPRRAAAARHRSAPARRAGAARACGGLVSHGNLLRAEGGGAGCNQHQRNREQSAHQELRIWCRNDEWAFRAFPPTETATNCFLAKSSSCFASYADGDQLAPPAIPDATPPPGSIPENILTVPDELCAENGRDRPVCTEPIAAARSRRGSWRVSSPGGGTRCHCGIPCPLPRSGRRRKADSAAPAGETEAVRRRPAPDVIHQCDARSSSRSVSST